jgi:hypothetical protein
MPYTPSCYNGSGHASGLFPPIIMPIAEEGQGEGFLLPQRARRDHNRDTTFSSMMARAGVNGRGSDVPEVPRVPENVAGLGRRRG